MTTPPPPPSTPTPPHGAPTHGAPPSPGPYGYRPAAPPTNTMAVVSLASSIAGVTLLPLVGSIVGIITGHVAIGQLRTSGEGGKGLAVAGLVVGYVGVLIIGLVLLTIAYSLAAVGGLVWMYS